MAYRFPEFEGVFYTHPIYSDAVQGLNEPAEQTISQEGKKDKKIYWQRYIYKHKGTGHFVGVCHTLSKPWRPIDIKRYVEFIENVMSTENMICGCALCIPDGYIKGYLGYVNFAEGCYGLSDWRRRNPMNLKNIVEESE